MSSLALPVATRTTAFLAGVSLVAIVALLSVLKARGVIPYDADSPQVFPFVLAYFFVTTLVFVIDLRSIAPKETKNAVSRRLLPDGQSGR